jgi:hypothetical protein
MNDARHPLACPACGIELAHVTVESEMIQPARVWWEDDGDLRWRLGVLPRDAKPTKTKVKSGYCDGCGVEVPFDEAVAPEPE